MEIWYYDDDEQVAYTEDGPVSYSDLVFIDFEEETESENSENT